MPNYRFLSNLFSLLNIDKIKQLFLYLSSTNKTNLKITLSRVKLIVALVCFIQILLVGKLLSFIGYDKSNLIYNITSRKNDAFKRANISDRNGNLLAVDLSISSVYANPRVMIDPEEAAEKLSKLFKDLKYSELLNKFKSKKHFVWIKRNIAPKEKYGVNKLGLPGVFFEEGHRRVYPHRNLTSHLLGYVGVDGMGLAGIEKYFDKELIVDPYNTIKNQDITLSIDLKAQFAIHEVLKWAFKEFSPEGAAVLLTNVKNGEIMAMVSMPDFDPHHISKNNSSNLFNRATLGSYELGSIVKSMTISMAIDSKVVSLLDSYDVSKPIKIDGYTLRDFRGGKGGIQNVAQIFINSSNIGTAKIILDMGIKNQQNYLEKFGFFDKIKLELPEIAPTYFPPKNKWGKLHSITIGYGHGMMLTPLHFIRAFNGIVNEGIAHDLTLIKNKKTPASSLVSKNTSEQMRKLLRLNVLDGSGIRANAKGFMVGGKTGSAEKTKKGGYDKKRNLSSLIAAFPINDPKYSLLVILDVPKGNKKTFGFSTGGWTAAPVAKKIIARLGPILNIEPVDEDNPILKKRMKIKGYKKLRHASY